MPIRSPRTLEKYKKIWTDKGSPLTVFSQQLSLAVQNELGGQFLVKTGFRYGDLNFQDAFADFAAQACDSVILAPMYPQKAQSSTETSLKEARLRAPEQFRLSETSEFYAQEWFVDAWSELILAGLKDKNVDHLVLSYHSLPLSHLQKATPNYQDQCLATSELIRKKMQWPNEKITTAFQSRVGVDKWIGPSTKFVLNDLAEKKNNKVAVACPSFVVDGLESLEEIGLELKKELQAKNVEIVLLPCLNSHPTWVKGLAQWLRSFQIKKLENQYEAHAQTPPPAPI